MLSVAMMAMVTRGILNWYFSVVWRTKKSFVFPFEVYKVCQEFLNMKTSICGGSLLSSIVTLNFGSISRMLNSPPPPMLKKEKKEEELNGPGLIDVFHSFQELLVAALFYFCNLHFDRALISLFIRLQWLLVQAPSHWRFWCWQILSPSEICCRSKTVFVVNIWNVCLLGLVVFMYVILFWQKVYALDIRNRNATTMEEN